jgi:hypothetical protein
MIGRDMHIWHVVERLGHGHAVFNGGYANQSERYVLAALFTMWVISPGLVPVHIFNRFPDGEQEGTLCVILVCRLCHGPEYARAESWQRLGFAHERYASNSALATGSHKVALDATTWRPNSPAICTTLITATSESGE